MTMIRIIPIASVQVESDRQRRYFDYMKLLELGQSIQANGLLQAPVVVEGTCRLVCGERRIKAILELCKPYSYGGQLIPPTHIPVLELPEADAVDLLEAEFAENVHRADLTWQEESSARARLHALRKMKNPGQTVRDTASEVFDRVAQGGDVTSISEDIALADNLNIPEVAKAKSKVEALKILRLVKQKEKNEALAKEFNGREDSTMKYRIVEGDAIDILATFPESFFDLLLTDPPYGIGADTFGDQTLINHEYDDSFESWYGLMCNLANRVKRVLKPKAHTFVFCDINRWSTLRKIFEAEGFYVWDRPLIWYKGNQGTLPRPHHGPRYTYEAILYAIRGDKEQQFVAHDVISIPTGLKPRHAAEKPVDLYIELMRRVSRPGDRILDPFAGCGTIFPAAYRSSCEALGVELVPANVTMCRQRIEEECK